MLGGKSPRSKIVKMRNLRGGRRTDVERTEGAKCADKTDFLTLDPITPERAIRLGKVCFDIVSLRNYITDNDSENGTVVFDKNPFTRQLFTEVEYEKINKKLLKLGMRPITLLFKKKRNLKYFDKIYEILASYNLRPPMWSNNHEDARAYFWQQNFSDPFKFFHWEDTCRLLDTPDRGNCLLRIRAEKDEYENRM